jgi:hypothetical protein
MSERTPSDIGKDKPINGVRSVRLYRPKARTRVTNGRGLLPNVDGRTIWVRRFRDLIALHLSDLGGQDQASEAEKAIIRRIATLIVELERLEMCFAEAGQATDHQLELYQRTANTLRRLLESVGMQRRPKDVIPIDQYLKQRVIDHKDDNGEALDEAAE